MSTPAARSTGSKLRLRAQGRRPVRLKGDNWLRHANPLSVWTRFAVVPLLALAIWSRDWIGWWSLAAVAAVLAFMMVNPLLFDEPRLTRSWSVKKRVRRAYLVRLDSRPSYPRSSAPPTCPT